MASARSGASRDTEEEKERHEAPQPRGPFPRYERIGEDLADARTRSPDPPEEEIPRTESWGELWTRAARRAGRR